MTGIFGYYLSLSVPLVLVFGDDNFVNSFSCMGGAEVGLIFSSSSLDLGGEPGPERTTLLLVFEEALFLKNI
jgi:hypothetical protein